MDNQHRKITGYRELDPQEIELINEIKDKGAELLALHARAVRLLGDQRDHKREEAAKAHAMTRMGEETGAAIAEYSRFAEAEPERWAAIAKTDIQTGVMALVRAIAQPGGGV